MSLDLWSRVQKPDARARDPRRSSEQASKVRSIKVTPWRNELSRLASNSGLQAGENRIEEEGGRNIHLLAT